MPAPMPRSNPTDPAAAEPTRQAASHTPASSLQLCFTGDVCLGSGIFTDRAGVTTPALLTDLHGMFRGSDLTVGNLEMSVAPHDGWRGGRRGAITVDPSRLEGLGRGPFQVFSLANNHVMDAGEAGLRGACALLQREGLAWLGAGANCREALRPLVVETRGRRVGLLAACDWSPHFARRTAAGIAPLEAGALEARVVELARQCDVVVVLLHADLEFAAHPAPWRMRLARRLARRGAHAVIQHHPHVIQGWERFDGAVIAYSLGNFVFRIDGNDYQAGRPGTRDGLILRLHVAFSDAGRACVTPRFEPVRIGPQHLPVPAGGDERERILQQLAVRSAELGDPRRVRAAWLCRSGVEVRRLLYGMYTDAARGAVRRAAAAPLRAALHPEDRRWLWGWLTAGHR